MANMAHPAHDIDPRPRPEAAGPPIPGPATSRTGVAVAAPRHARGQALALMAVLVPVAVALAWGLALAAGATQGARAATVTAVICALGGAAILTGLGRAACYPHPHLGWGNGLTLLRGAGIAAMAGLVVVPAQTLGWTLVALSALVLALDGLDGRVARLERRQSRFGARFDVESDVVFALTLAALAVSTGQVGAWFLALGLLRPAFLAAGRIWPALRAPLPEARWRKRAAGAQMAIQVALLAPVLAPPVTSLVGAGLLSAMVLSFLIDIRWLVRQERAG